MCLYTDTTVLTELLATEAPFSEFYFFLGMKST